MLIGRSIKSVRRVWIRHSPRREDTEIIGDTEAGVPFSTVWDEVPRLLVSQNGEAKPWFSESRQAKVRRSLMATKPQTQQEQWVCFGLGRVFWETCTGIASDASKLKYVSIRWGFLLRGRCCIQSTDSLALVVL